MSGIILLNIMIIRARSFEYRHILKILICISLSLLIVLLMPGCITIQGGPQTTSPSSTHSGISPQGSTTKDKPVIETFTVSPSQINSGQNATLSWTVIGADAVIITPSVGQVEFTGTRQVSPDESTEYILTAANSAGTVSVTVKINVESTNTDSPSTFAVLEVVAATAPSPDHCPEILYADITTNGAGNVEYRWESIAGGGYSYTFSVSFASAGTQRVTLFEQMRGLPSGMYQLRVISPNEIISNTIHYTTCAP